MEIFNYMYELCDQLDEKTVSHSQRFISLGLRVSQLLFGFSRVAAYLCSICTVSKKILNPKPFKGSSLREGTENSMSIPAFGKL